MLPGIGESWAAKASLLNNFNELAIYAKQFDAVLALMKAGDSSLHVLAPTIPSVTSPVMMALTMMKTAVSKKELALLGASQGKNNAMGTLFMTGGSDAEPEVVDT
jgi:hypothetical protein